MSGFITKIEVIENKEMIIAAYGIAFYIACLDSVGTTFLSLLVKFKKI